MIEHERELDTVEHLAINVADIESSVHWYTTSFSCSVQYQDRQQAILKFRNVSLQLLLPSLQPGHIAFSRKDADSLGELREQALGLRSTFLADPAGNVVEITQAE